MLKTTASIAHWEAHKNLETVKQNLKIKIYKTGTSCVSGQNPYSLNSFNFNITCI